MRYIPATPSDGFVIPDGPDGYPFGHPTAGPFGVPVLRGISAYSNLDALVAFNDLGRAVNAATSAVHFCKPDKTFQDFMRSPLNNANKYDGFGAICTPDPTITMSMRPWQRALRVVWARQVGATLESRGWQVLPFLRWVTKSDYELVTAGVPTGSIIAVSIFASSKDRQLRFAFEQGMPEIVERLNPAAVLVLGRATNPVFRQLRKKTEFVPCPYPAWKPLTVKAIALQFQSENLFDLGA